jgi:hypothetical protein
MHVRLLFMSTDCERAGALAYSKALKQVVSLLVSPATVSEAVPRPLHLSSELSDYDRACWSSHTQSTLMGTSSAGGHLKPLLVYLPLW